MSLRIEHNDTRVRNTSKVYGVKNHKLIPEEYHELLFYNHKTGDLIWKPRGDRSWDPRFANKIAGSINKNGYREFKTKINGCYMAHRIAWLLYYGVDPAGYEIDHVDRNRSNNCITNLRLATPSFNVQTSKKTKVFTKRPVTNKYYCNIYVNNTNIYLGDYDTEVEARAAYNEALLRYKPIYCFTNEEQEMLDLLYTTYPKRNLDLQRACHDLHVKAITHYVDILVVQTQN